MLRLRIGLQGGYTADAAVVGQGHPGGQAGAYRASGEDTVIARCGHRVGRAVGHDVTAGAVRHVARRLDVGEGKVGVVERVVGLYGEHITVFRPSGGRCHPRVRGPVFVNELKFTRKERRIAKVRHVHGERWRDVVA